ncbi:hypothetical protein [Roseibium aggregatum]|uniref:hypothetical protein n=1 Tax=Roseibium aggregatum TaxID=187304 RepID=UPI003A969F10
MEPVVTLEGVKKLPAGAERQASAFKGQGAAGSQVPLDGHSVLHVSLDRETLLIAGVGEAFAGGLPAILNEDPKLTVPCTVSVLPAGSRLSGKKRPFVAILSLANSPVSRPERVTIRSQGHAYPFGVRQQAADLKSFLQSVGELTPQSVSDIVDGLVQALLLAGAGPQAMQTAARIVDAVAGRDGFIEVLGVFDAGDIYLQGWAKGMPAGTNRVFVFDGALKLGELSGSLFERKDTGGKAYGFAGLLEVEGGLDAGLLRKVFFRGRAGWSAVEVHEHRTMPPARALPSHIRALLPKLSPAGDGRARLELAGRRFDGRETVSELDVPVRVGIDFSASLDRAGVLLSGWLLNPEDRVEAVLLRSGCKSCRLDTRWTTQPRPDVTSAFETLSPFLSGPDALQRHGFLVHVPAEEMSGSDGTYLEIVLKDGRTAFAPLALGRASPRSALRRLLSGLDPATALRPDFLERHLLPVLQASDAPDPAVVETIDFGPVADGAVFALVIGLDGNFETSRVLLSLCALDPVLRGAPVVLVASQADAVEQIEDFRQLAGFYGLAVRLVLADHVEDALDALQAGVEASPSETVVCLSSGVLPRAAGWLEPLLAAFQAHEAACIVAPTLLYEDDTIRWGGAWIEPEDGHHLLKQHYLGYPRRTLHGAEVSPVAAAPFDCCVLPKSALAEAGGFSRKYLGTDEKGLDAALRLKLSGIGSLWVPQVEMIHAEDGRPGERSWKKLVGELDRRSFERIWSPVLPDLAEDIA